MSEKPKRQRARRGRGEGSVYFRPDGRWVGRLTVGYDANGKRKRRVVYGKTKAEVLGELAKLQSKRVNGDLDDAAKITVAKYLETWLATAKTTLRASTFDSYAALVKNHINPRVGGVKLAGLTPLHVRSILSQMEEAGLSPRHRQYVRTVLRRALKQALKWGMIPRNPCDAVDGPHVPRHEFTPLDEAQTLKFLETISGDDMEPVYVLAIMSGLRQGELLGLQWGDLDLEAGRLSVRRTLQFKSKRGFWTEEPKTAKGRRMVELDARALEALQAHRVKALAAGRMGFPWVFCHGDGEPFNRFHVIAHFERTLAAAGLPSIRFHDLRHSHATLMLSAGVHPKIVQERLGHSTIGITLDTYSHVMPGLQREAVGKLEGLLARNGHKLATKTPPEAATGS